MRRFLVPAARIMKPESFIDQVSDIAHQTTPREEGNRSGHPSSRNEIRLQVGPGGPTGPTCRFSVALAIDSSLSSG